MNAYTGEMNARTGEKHDYIGEMSAYTGEKNAHTSEKYFYSREKQHDCRENQHDGREKYFDVEVITNSCGEKYFYSREKQHDSREIQHDSSEKYSYFREKHFYIDEMSDPADSKSDLTRAKRLFAKKRQIWDVGKYIAGSKPAYVAAQLRLPAEVQVFKLNLYK